MRQTIKEIANRRIRSLFQADRPPKTERGLHPTKN